MMSTPYNTGDLVGTVVDGRYRIERLLGEGGMGAVYEATHVALDSKVALKVLNSLSASDAQRQRFLREARAAAQIRHENVVYISDFGGQPVTFFVMERLQGRDLSEVLRTEGRLPWSRAKPLLLQTIRALAAAHERGIVHRDIKPSNIFVVQREDGSELVKVLDFGIAKVLAGQADERGLTGTGQIIGTGGYMAPEQVLNEPVDGRTDIYTLGIVMFEVLTGRLPFGGASTFELLKDHVQRPAPNLPYSELGLPLELDAVVQRALAKSPWQRFATMDELRLAVEAIPPAGTRPADPVLSFEPPSPMTPAPSASNLTVVAPTGERPRSQRVPSPWLVGGGLVAVLTAIVGALVVRGIGPSGNETVAVAALEPTDAVVGDAAMLGGASDAPEPSHLAGAVTVPSTLGHETEAASVPSERDHAAGPADDAPDPGHGAESALETDASGSGTKPVHEVPKPDGDLSRSAAQDKASVVAPGTRAAEPSPRKPPRSDRAVLASFVRRAEASCDPVVPTHVVLQVLPSGVVPMANTTPKNACIEGVAKGTAFSPRPRPDRFERDIP